MFIIPESVNENAPKSGKHREKNSNSSIVKHKCMSFSIRNSAPYRCRMRSLSSNVTLLRPKHTACYFPIKCLSRHVIIRKCIRLFEYINRREKFENNGSAKIRQNAKKEDKL